MPDMTHTFAAQSSAWLQGLKKRRRGPSAPATIAAYSSHVRRLLPLIGDTLLENINNGTLKDLVERLEGSPKTIHERLLVVKQVIKSARDPQSGAQLYPRMWDHEFIDAPTITGQKRPTVTAEQIDRAIETADAQQALLYTLLAGAGIRISEALAIRVGRVSAKHSAFLEDDAMIQVRASVWRNQEYPGKTKTEASKRDVDLAPALSAAVGEFIRKQKIEPGAFLFQSDDGVANLKSLTRALEKQGIPGFHCFRRFRVTFLREAGVPEFILKQWIGHASDDVTDLYTKTRLEVRRRWAAEAGLGFSLEALNAPVADNSWLPDIFFQQEAR